MNCVAFFASLIAPRTPQSIDLKCYSPLWQSGGKVLEDLGTCGVHQRLTSQTVFTAALRQEFLAVFRTVEVSSQHRSQCKYTTKGPHLGRVFCLFKWPCSWLWATGDPSHPSDIKFPFLKLPVSLFEVFPSPCFIGW